LQEEYKKYAIPAAGGLLLSKNKDELFGTCFYSVAATSSCSDGKE